MSFFLDLKKVDKGLIWNEGVPAPVSSFIYITHWRSADANEGEGNAIGWIG